MPQPLPTPLLAHYTALAQCHDFLGRIAAAGENLVAVLPKGRGRSWGWSWCPGEFDRLLHRAIPPDLWMIKGCDKILGEDLRVVEHVLDRAHRCAGHALAEQLLPFEGTAVSSA